MMAAQTRARRDAMESKDCPLLHWLLWKYPDTPKSRAKQWILAGRVSVNGIVIRKPHHRFPIRGKRWSCATAMPRLWRAGRAGRFIRGFRCFIWIGPGHCQQGAGTDFGAGGEGELSALSILADFLAGKLRARDAGVAGIRCRRLTGGCDRCPFTGWTNTPAGSFAWRNPAARHHLDRAIEGAHDGAGICGLRGRAAVRAPWDLAELVATDRDQLRQLVISDAQARAAGDEAREAVTHYEVIAEYARAGGKEFCSKLRLRLETGRKHQIRVQAAEAGLP